MGLCCLGFSILSRLRHRQYPNLPHNACRIVKIQIARDSSVVEIDDAYPAHSEPFARLIDCLICTAENPLDDASPAFNRTLQQLEFHIGNSLEEKGSKLPQIC